MYCIAAHARETRVPNWVVLDYDPFPKHVPFLAQSHQSVGELDRLQRLYDTLLLFAIFVV